MVEIFPAYEEERAIRVEFFGDEIETISEIDPLRGVRLQKLPRVTIYPGSHYVTTLENRKRAIETDPRGAARAAAQSSKQLGKAARGAAPLAAHAL